MNEVSKALLHKASLRKACRSFTLDEAEKVLADLTDIVKKRRQEARELKAAEQAKRKKMASIRKKIKDSGLELKDVLALMPGQGSVVPKYRFIDKSGVIHTWSGRGRTPKVFQEQFDAGHAKEEYLIHH